MLDKFYSDFIVVLQNLLKSKRSKQLYRYVECLNEQQNKEMKEEFNNYSEHDKKTNRNNIKKKRKYNIDKSIKKFLKNTRLIILKHISILKNNRKLTKKINIYLASSLKNYSTENIDYDKKDIKIIDKLEYYHRVIHFLECIKYNKPLSKFMNINYNTEELEVQIKRNLKITEEYKIKEDIIQDIQKRDKSLLESIITVIINEEKELKNNKLNIKIQENNNNIKIEEKNNLDIKTIGNTIKNDEDHKETIFYHIIKKDIKNILKTKESFIRLIFLLTHPNNTYNTKKIVNTTIKLITKDVNVFTALRFYYYTRNYKKYFIQTLKNTSNTDNIDVITFITNNFRINNNMKYILLKFIINTKNYKETYNYINKYKIVNINTTTEEVIEYFVRNTKFKVIETTGNYGEIQAYKNIHNDYYKFIEFIITIKSIRAKKKINIDLEFYKVYLINNYKYLKEILKYMIDRKDNHYVILSEILRMEMMGIEVSDIKKDLLTNILLCL